MMENVKSPKRRSTLPVNRKRCRHRRLFSCAIICLFAHLIGKKPPSGSLLGRSRDFWSLVLMLSGLSLPVYLWGQKGRLIMWQRSHGRWLFLMRRKVCLTNYPGGQTTCFSNATFFLSSLPLSHSGYFFSPRLLSTCAEPWHLTLIFAFELALQITMYWLTAITFLFLFV